ncbi:MAG TPA: site-2 protease family protein [Methanocellales archaeon]|nr:site-2 protease family protein [Methanocellales archaeon]
MDRLSEEMWKFIVPDEVFKSINQEFWVENLSIERGSPIFYVKAPTDITHSIASLRFKLKDLGYLPCLSKRGDRLAITLAHKPKHKPERRIWNLLLFLTTVCTTLWVGYQMSLDLVRMDLMASPLQGAIPFSVGITAILGFHELGHKLMADRRGVEATLPYFIPEPGLFIGTFGAVIKMKSPSLDRNSLFDVASMGPVAGFLVLVPATILGLLWSYTVPIEAIPEGTFVLPAPILFELLQRFIVSVPEGYSLLTHPLAFAGWVGMLVTMLNLMPVGMLDGGHISRALLGGDLHRVVSFIGVIATFMIGFWMMAVFMLFFAMSPHSGPLDDVSPLTPKRKLISLFLGSMLILCLTPLWGAHML